MQKTEEQFRKEVDNMVEWLYEGNDKLREAREGAKNYDDDKLLEEARRDITLEDNFEGTEDYEYQVRKRYETKKAEKLYYGKTLTAEDRKQMVDNAALSYISGLLGMNLRWEDQEPTHNERTDG